MIWPDEASQGHANLYCAKGRSCNCEALFLIPPPQTLRELLTSELAPGACVPPATISFHKHIRKYNSSLQMASSDINIKSPADGVSVIAIRGVVHHLMGPLTPLQGSPHQFAQLYSQCGCSGCCSFCCSRSGQRKPRSSHFTRAATDAFGEQCLCSALCTGHGFAPSRPG